jgi:protein-S-isoprenylcysteine O-methyltransferase Ste14
MLEQERHIPMGDRPSYVVFTLVQIIAVAFILWMVFSMPGPWDWQRVMGVALMLVGAAGIATARYQLGKSFSLTPQARQLVTRGIYSKIRNPIYVSGCIMLAGFVLVLHRPVLWLVLLALIVMQTFRARREAQVLEAAFGDAYREYRRKTWF